MQKKLLIAVGAVTLLAALSFLGYLYFFGGIIISESSRNGYLQKFGSKYTVYFVWTTHEGELALHGSGGSNVGKSGQSGSQFSNTWAFSVVDDNVIKQLEEIQSDENDTSKAVTLYYDEYWFRGWYGTNYRIKKAIWLSNPNKPKSNPTEYFK